MPTSKPHYLHLHIHSCMATASSRDTWLKMVLPEMPDLTALRTPNPYREDESRVVVGPVFLKGLLLHDDGSAEEKEFFHHHYFSDNTFYEKAAQNRNFMDGYDNDPLYLKLVEQYVDLGWVKDLAPEWETLLKKENDYEEAANLKFRIEAGYVIPQWKRDLPVQAYKGALPSEVFDDAGLQKYLKGGGCHGYIGSFSRTVMSDKALVEDLRDHNWTDRMIAEFLSCSRGRHFADQLDHENCSREYIASIFHAYDPSGEDWFQEAIGEPLLKPSRIKP